MTDQITIGDILRIVEELKTGAGIASDNDPLKKSILEAFAEAEQGLTLPELVETLLGREITSEEDQQLVLGEPAEGSA